MRIGMPMKYSGGFTETVDELADYEQAGLDVVHVPEAYSFDSVSQLGYLAARTTRLEIAAGILNIYSRTPSLLAMTAAGLDYVSGGRFVLGLGASGPQVVEGFHGLPYHAPLARTREVAEICRKVWRREPVVHEGTHYRLPLDREHGGSGVGKPLKLINHPVRERIPMILAALGPKNVSLAAELFEGWEPIFYFPERARASFGEALDAGLARRDAALGPLQIVADTHVAVVDDDEAKEEAMQQVRNHLALYVGGMGARGKNFYNDLARRYGFEEAATSIQDHFLAGRRAEAAAAVPDALVHGVSLIGSVDWIKERVAAFAETGVTTLNATPLAATHEQRVRDIATLKEAVS
ncbi:LLM class F420-dependent oxidoreductase [Peterkaempfera bronchialis]|uniref:LLM class F420-dependent oxidoreductase n=1 Tax=Peterkaempfera bronchialis TaxID=2126346 RepID=A0A345SR52_9ACTN|nr:LLM class F420-dependent oxidoreductase [Peterkaempfera bronchialis]AXI76207.1 LLM class F420-dependent oxidoreductase [Peterkaempfera bronchialis]